MEMLENAFQDEFKLSLECLIRMFTSVHQSYSFDEVKRPIDYSDFYDIGNLLLLGVQHSICFAVRRPDLGNLRLEENLKYIFRMFATEGRVSPMLDCNSLYLTEMLMRGRVKNFERALVEIPLIRSEAHIFLKGLFVYLADMDFDMNELADFPERRFFLEDLLEQKLLEPMLQLEVSPVSEKDDFLDSIFFWEFYDRPLENSEKAILRWLLMLRLFNQAIGMVQDTMVMSRITYDDSKLRMVSFVVQDNLIKICLKILRTIKKHRYNTFFQRMRKLSPQTAHYAKDLLLKIIHSIKQLSEQVIFFSALLFYANKEGLDLSTLKITTSKMIDKIDPLRVRYDKENKEVLDLLLKSLKDL